MSGEKQKPARDWISARNARALVGSTYPHQNHAAEAIIQEAAANRIHSRADRLVVDSKDSPRFKIGDEVDYTFWRDFRDRNRTREDWVAGTFIFEEGGEFHAVHTFGVHGVEFCANDLRNVFKLAKLPALPSPPPSNTISTRREPQPGRYANKVGAPELREWLKGFATRNPDGLHFKLILQNARDAFKPRPVTERIMRNAIADLNMTKSRGNPRITRKKR